MSNLQRGGEPLQLDGGQLGLLRFRWQTDRYQHAWEFGDPAEGETITSVESSSNQVWPASPPLQQIHAQEFGDGRRVIFGVGMAGRGHWSASFTLVPDLKCWFVELACRSSVQPEILQSSYRVGAGWKQDSPQLLSGSKADYETSIEAIAPAKLSMEHEDLLRIVPASIDQATEPTTIQWAFRLRVLG